MNDTHRKLLQRDVATQRLSELMRHLHGVHRVTAPRQCQRVATRAGADVEDRRIAGNNMFVRQMPDSGVRVGTEQWWCPLSDPRVVRLRDRTENRGDVIVDSQSVGGDRVRHSDVGARRRRKRRGELVPNNPPKLRNLFFGELHAARPEGIQQELNIVLQQGWHRRQGQLSLRVAEPQNTAQQCLVQIR